LARLIAYDICEQVKGKKYTCIVIGINFWGISC